VYNNNIVYNNAPNMSLVSGTQSGTLALTSAQFSALFVNYTGAGMTGDYQLQGGAMAIDRGTTLCAASVVVCVPVLDFTGILRPHLQADAVTAVPVVSVVASANDGNIPQNTLDNNLATRWSANGDGQWIRYDFGAVMALSRLDIAWYNGTAWASAFEIQVSSD